MVLLFVRGATQCHDCIYLNGIIIFKCDTGIEDVLWNTLIIQGAYNSSELYIHSIYSSLYNSMLSQNTFNFNF